MVVAMGLVLVALSLVQEGTLDCETEHVVFQYVATILTKHQIKQKQFVLCFYELLPLFFKVLCVRWQLMLFLAD